MAQGYCSKCGKFIKRIGKTGMCHECYVVDSEEHSRRVREALRDPKVRQRKSEAAKKSWQKPGVWERHSRGMKAAHARGDHDNSAAMKKAWANGVFDNVFTPEVKAKRDQTIKEACQKPEIREIKSEAAKKVWQRPEYQDQISQARKAAWENGIYDERDFSGENNPSWRGGLSFEPYGPDFNDELKQYIRERDDCCCVLCGIPENGQAHDCHHCNYQKDDNDPSNLLTMCKPCHGRTNHNRRFWRTVLAPMAMKRERR